MFKGSKKTKNSVYRSMLILIQILVYLKSCSKLFKNKSTVTVPCAYSAGSAIQDKELEFTKSLYSLQQQPKFNLMLFENEIDKIRLCVDEVSISL